MYIDIVLGMGYNYIVLVYWLYMGVYCIGYGCILYWVWVYIVLGMGV